MTLTKPSLETLIDLVENKLSCMDVWDREDRRQAVILKRCLGELSALYTGDAGPAAGVIAFGTGRRRGRRPRAAQNA